MNAKMTRILIITGAILIVFNGHGQTDTAFVKAIRYTTKKFDVAIFPDNYKDFVGGKRFTPTRREIRKAELALSENLKPLNKQLINQTSTPVIHKNLRKYKRQYFGYIDKNDNRILLVNCFWSKNDDSSEDWLENRIQVFDGGSYYWCVKFNLDKNELFDLEINGYS